MTTYSETRLLQPNGFRRAALGFAQVSKIGRKGGFWPLLNDVQIQAVFLLREGYLQT